MTKLVRLTAALGIALGGLALSGCAHQKEQMASMDASRQAAESAAAQAKQAAAEARAAADEAKAAADAANRSYGRSMRK